MQRAACEISPHRAHPAAQGTSTSQCSPQRALACQPGKAKHVLLGRLVFPVVILLSISASCPLPPASHVKRKSKRKACSALSRVEVSQCKRDTHPAGMRQHISKGSRGVLHGGFFKGRGMYGGYLRVKCFVGRKGAIITHWWRGRCM